MTTEKTLNTEEVNYDAEYPDIASKCILANIKYLPVEFVSGEQNKEDPAETIMTGDVNKAKGFPSVESARRYAYENGLLYDGLCIQKIQQIRIYRNFPVKTRAIDKN